MTNRVMYGDDAPLFQVTVQSIFSLKKLIAKLPQVHKELETTLKGKRPILVSFSVLYCRVLYEFIVESNTAMLSGSAVEGQDIDCEVTTQLYLVCPNMAKKDTRIIPVEEDNLVMCVDLWKSSALFEFGDVFRAMKMDSRKTPKKLRG